MESKYPECCQIIEADYEMLKQAVLGLASEVEYVFCLGCYNYGKNNKFKSIACMWCKDSVCNECSILHNYSIDGTNYEVCDSCYKNLSGKNSIIFKLSERGKNNLTLDRMIDIFSHPGQVFDYMIDKISEELMSGEYYQYELNLINFSDIDGTVCLLVNIDSSDKIEQDEINDGDEEEIDDIIEEIGTHLSETIDGFSFDKEEPPCSFLKNPDMTEKIIIDMEII
jgi:hypothetical protein